MDNWETGKLHLSVKFFVSEVHVRLAQLHICGANQEDRGTLATNTREYKFIKFSIKTFLVICFQSYKTNGNNLTLYASLYCVTDTYVYQVHCQQNLEHHLEYLCSANLCHLLWNCPAKQKRLYKTKKGNHNMYKSLRMILLIVWLIWTFRFPFFCCNWLEFTN